MANNEGGAEHGVTLDPPTLFDEFSSPTYEAWYEEAVASLKGAPFEKKVITRTYEGIDLKPLYTARDLEDLPHLGSLPGFPPFARGANAGGYVVQPWEISQEIGSGLPETFNEVARDGLGRGQNALSIQLDGPTLQGKDAPDGSADAVGRGGLSLSTPEDLARALDGIEMAQTPLFVRAGGAALPLLSLFGAWLRRSGRNHADLKGCIGADPLGELARSGSLPLPLDAAYGSMAATVAWCAEHAPGLQTVLVRACPYHDAGASAVQELAFAVATGVEYVRALQERGLGIDAIAGSMRFCFSVGSHFFMEIAKLRAARVLWCQVVDAFGGGEDACKMRIHGRTSRYTKTVYDPYVNMLRNTAEAFAALMGGVDSLHVRGFDEAVRSGDEFSRRVSRNLQLVLREEAHFTHPVDPGGGSACLEVLTDELGRRAWALFQGVEAAGGMRKVLEAGMPQRAAAETAKKRAANLAVRKDVFVGTNQYANLLERPLPAPEMEAGDVRQQRVERVEAHRSGRDAAAWKDAASRLRESLDTASEAALTAGVEAAEAGATLGDLAALLASAGSDRPAVEPLDVHRGAEPYEHVRKRSETLQAEQGLRIRVFLANMGPIPQHKARADFTTGFFEVGGFEVLGNHGFPDVESAARAATESGAPVVVICSTDKTYPEIVPPLVRRIKEAGPETVVILAGKPAAEHEATYREAGLDDCIHIRANCLEMLERLQTRFGG